MEDARLPKSVMFGEMVRGAGCIGGQEKELSALTPTRDDCSPG